MSGDPDINDLPTVLHAKDGDVFLDPGLTTTDYELAIDGAPSVTIGVQDKNRGLLKSGLLDANDDGRLDTDLDLTLDGGLYRLSSLQKAGDTFTLTFGDLAVSVAQHTRGHIKPRNQDHVAFARRLVTQLGFEFVTPTGVPVVADSPSTLATKNARKQSDNRREPGVPDQADVTVKGHKASALQKRNMDTVLGVCAQEHAGPKASLACVVACIVESEFLNLPGGDRDSKGILQLRVGLHGEATASSIVKSVRAFLNKGFTGKGGAAALAKKHPEWTAGQIAQAVQGSDFPARYDIYLAEGRKIIAAFDGGDTTTNTSRSTTRTSGRSPVQVGTSEDPEESYWAALQRIATERGYRCFVIRNTFYYGREQDFIRSRARAVISEQDDGIDAIDGLWAPNAEVNESVVTARANLWAAPPGTPVIVTDLGPLSGRWLIVGFRRSRFSKQAEITMRRGTALLKPEPSQSTGSASVRSTSSSTSRRSLTGAKPGIPVTKLTRTGEPHETAGLSGYPARDYFAPAGSPVVAPVAGKILRFSGHDPANGPTDGVHGPFGYSIYLQGDDGKTYYLTHLGSRTCRVGEHVSQGQQIGTVGDYARWGGADHVHMGIHS